ncbi:MAG: Nucleotidyltransferase/DNA polymerase involved in repair-like protein [Rariglobus sp.]|jgi:protein ImuB|nr:Nucleotidyltransferase/DNA polymerase involved in repair-like protein [Rariglobus sp.]
MFAVLHLADFALQAVLRTEPAAAHRPAALLDPTRRPPLLLACTASARALGVEIGQTSPQALARCEHLRLFTPHNDAEKEAAAGLLAAAFSISPYVEATAPGVCTLQINGLPPDKREPALRASIEQLAALGLHATAGAGPTPLLALYAARQAGPLLMIGNERAFLAPLPLAAADPPAELTGILAGWGVRTLGDLTDLSKASVAQRLGPAGLALWERAAGEASRPLHLVSPPPAFSASMECEYELETLEPLLFLLRRFVDRLALELHTASLAAAELTLALHLADETTLTRTIRLPEPSTQADTLFRTLHTYLESVRTTTAVIGLRLDLTPTRIATRQHGLFDRALRDSHGFAETLARIAAIVGSDRLGTPVPADTHRPDVFTLIPPQAEIPACEPHRTLHPPQGLVLRRYRPPRPATVELAGARQAPAYVRTPHVEGNVRAVAGPWHASGGWWQADQLWQREEWDVELDGLYRLVRTPEGWFVEGEYD